MSCLVFCSFEVGGLPYKIAETLNRYGVKTYYLSLAQNAHGHDSAKFHYGEKREEWDLSPVFNGRRRVLHKDIGLLKELKSRYEIDYCFATGHKAYLLKEAGMNYDYWSYGSDLDQYRSYFVLPVRREALKTNCVSEAAFLMISGYRLKAYQLFPEPYSVWKKAVFYPYLLRHFCREQKRSILDADSLMIAPYQLDFYKRLRSDKRLFFLPHSIKVAEYDSLRREKDRKRREICEKIDADRFFFSSARHFWAGKKGFFTDYKGNDIVLRSFAHYLGISGDTKSKLILVRKGPDVRQSNELAQDLGINKHIFWIDEMPRKDLWDYYRGASACFGQFGVPLLTYAAVEPLSNAAPCISFVGDDNASVPFYNTMPPVFNSKDSGEIALFMHRITSDTDYESTLSYDSWIWAKENCSENKFVEAFLKASDRT